MSALVNVRSSYCPAGRISGRANVYRASVCELLSGQIAVQSGYCVSGKCQSGSCLSGMCPRGSVRRASVPQETFWIPNRRFELFKTKLILKFLIL